MSLCIRTHRNGRYTCIAATTVCVLVFLASLCSQQHGTVRLYPKVQQQLRKFNLPERPSSFSLRANRTSCSERFHIVFIKVHKAGSSTIANIIMRFGVSRNLSFALPKTYVIITFWQNQHLKIRRLHKGEKFDILCNHAVYSRGSMESIMASDSVYISVVREPMAHLQSSLHYFFKRAVPGKDKLQSYLRNPALVRNRRLLNNSMSYELGLPPEDFKNKTAILKHLHKLDKEFEIIMITERMDESILLLKRYMCWSLQDILYMSRNVNRHKPAVNITPRDLAILNEVELADTMLYQYSVDRLNGQISREEGFDEELHLYKSMLRRVSEFCTSSNKTENDVLIFYKSKWNEEFKHDFSQCKVMRFGGLQILKYVKEHQSKKDLDFNV